MAVPSAGTPACRAGLLAVAWPTAPGPVPVFSVPGRAYNYGGTPNNPGGLDAYVECSYLNGVNVFLADSFVFFSSDGACVVTPDPVVRRIDRTP